MADAEATESDDEAEKPKKGGIGKIIVWGIVFCLGIGTGTAVSLFVLPESKASPQAALPDQMDIPEPDDKIAFIEIDEVVVNLDDQRFSRYVTCTFSLQVAASQEAAIQALVDEQEAKLVNWLIAHLRDKKLEDVRGKLGHNTLRREIHDEFNRILFTDGVERFQDVLFRDFKVQ